LRVARRVLEGTPMTRRPRDEPEGPITWIDLCVFSLWAGLLIVLVYFGIP
jgi:hypothetical protein